MYILTGPKKPPKPPPSPAVTQPPAPPPRPAARAAVPLGVVVTLRMWGLNFTRDIANNRINRTLELQRDVATAFSGLCQVDPAAVAVYTVANAGRQQYTGVYGNKGMRPAVDVSLTSNCTAALAGGVVGVTSALQQLSRACLVNLGEKSGNAWLFG
jgi:hypothetical protein